MNAVGDSELCVRAEKRTHTFRAAFYPYQCRRPTDTAIVSGEKEKAVHISTDDAHAQWYATGLWRSLSPSAAAPTQYGVR